MILVSGTMLVTDPALTEPAVVAWWQAAPEHRSEKRGAAWIAHAKTAMAEAILTMIAVIVES